MERLRVRSRQKRRETFLFQSQLSAQTLIRRPFHPRRSAEARKRPRSFCQKCKWQVTAEIMGVVPLVTPKHSYTLNPTSRSGLIMLSPHSVETYRGNELTRNSSGNARSQTFQFAGLKSETYVCELISTKNNPSPTPAPHPIPPKKVHAGIDSSTIFPPYPRKRGKKPVSPQAATTNPPFLS